MAYQEDTALYVYNEVSIYLPTWYWHKHRKTWPDLHVLHKNRKRRGKHLNKFFLLFSQFYKKSLYRPISFQSVESLTGSPRRATGEVNRNAIQTTTKNLEVWESEKIQRCVERWTGSPRRATGEVNQDILVDKMVKNSFIDEHYQDRQQRKAKTFK